MSVGWTLGFAAGSQSVALAGYLERSLGLGPTPAFQGAVGLLAAVALVFPYLPVIFIRERRYCQLSWTLFHWREAMNRWSCAIRRSIGPGAGATE